jgi:predicted enzyme related to lactoylglutathione lyase
MLSKAAVTTTIPAVDINRAKKFYSKTLGLKIVKEDDSGLTVESANGVHIYIYKRGATKADHTVLSFKVASVEEEVAALKSKGVKFEEYDIPDMGIKTVGGIAKNDGFTSAWFKDSEGNILAISNM